MIMRKMLRCSLPVVVLCWSMLLFIRPAMANCTINVPTATAPMPLQLGNITVGADLADGTELYKQTYNLNFSSNSLLVNCTGNAQFYGYYSFSNTPLPPSSWSGGNSGKVYETGVPGIGIYVRQGTNGSITMPDKKPLFPLNGHTGTCTGSSCNPFEGFRRWDIHLIKTGPVSPGTIQGSQLPCVKVNYTNDVPSDENMVQNVCMAGSINVVASTCKTPDVTVPMGSYDVSTFSGEGSATKWVDASIKLTDCPVYHGHGGRGSWYVDGRGTNNSGKQTKNSIMVKLTPATTVINSSQGIFGFTQTANSASGAGIQLAYGTGASPEFVDFGNTKTYEMDIGTTGISEIPLVARYIQTDKHVTPGKADSAVTFLINYY